jgi:hypothetical protein
LRNCEYPRLTADGLRTESLALLVIPPLAIACRLLLRDPRQPAAAS